MMELILKAVAYGTLITLTTAPQATLGQNQKKVQLQETETAKDVGVVKAKQKEDIRIETLEEFLDSYNSPMASEAETFVEVADKYNLDWRFLPAITGMESIFGKRVASNSYNPFGWGGGYIKFNSWEQAINTVGKSLGERSAENNRYGPEAWAPIYCPPNAHNWTTGVRYFMGEIEKEYFANLAEAGGTIAAAR
ncbi:MAG: hypothetical protein U9M98_01020 [Patescibacteria group bacterium]|nr:hypothetical protein [Patescibacteria group bacterium]